MYLYLRLRYQTSAGLQSIAIDDTQYNQDERQAWTKPQRASPLRWPNFIYAKDAVDARLEGLDIVDGEACAVISFKAPNVVLYRNWVGLTTGWLPKQQMFARGHNMLTTFAQYNSPIQIAAP